MKLLVRLFHQKTFGADVNPYVNAELVGAALLDPSQLPKEQRADAWMHSPTIPKATLQAQHVPVLDNSRGEHDHTVVRLPPWYVEHQTQATEVYHSSITTPHTPLSNPASPTPVAPLSGWRWPSRKFARSVATANHATDFLSDKGHDGRARDTELVFLPPSVDASEGSSDTEAAHGGGGAGPHTHQQQQLTWTRMQPRKGPLRSKVFQPGLRHTCNYSMGGGDMVDCYGVDTVRQCAAGGDDTVSDASSEDLLHRSAGSQKYSLSRTGRITLKNAEGSTSFEPPPVVDEKAVRDAFLRFFVSVLFDYQAFITYRKVSDSPILFMHMKYCLAFLPASLIAMHSRLLDMHNVTMHALPSDVALLRPPLRICFYTIGATIQLQHRASHRLGRRLGLNSGRILPHGLI